MTNRQTDTHRQTDRPRYYALPRRVFVWTGLCGFYDGDPYNDLRLRNGSVYQTTRDVYPWSFPADYCAEWRYDCTVVVYSPHVGSEKLATDCHQPNADRFLNLFRSPGNSVSNKVIISDVSFNLSLLCLGEIFAPHRLVIANIQSLSLCATLYAYLFDSRRRHFIRYATNHPGRLSLLPSAER